MTNRDEKSQANSTDYVLDITGDVCPLTFVRTKLLIERMAAGETASVLLRGAEPLQNVPRAVISQGHIVLDLLPLANTGNTEGVHRLRIRKGITTDRRS